ncbi:MAG: formyltransferase family protein [Chitinophagaceae bacterium]
MRIVILCNDRIALPAMDQLFSAGLVAGVGVPARAQEMLLLLRQRCDAYRVPLRSFEKKDLDSSLAEWLESINPDVVLVKTFPYLISARCISIPAKGIINFHYAPLPEWRGPNPVFWMIRNGASEGAITVHQMNESFDEGPVLLKQPVPISPDVNFGMYYTQLAYAGVQATATLLQQLINGSVTPKEQNNSQAKWYDRPAAADLFINWAIMSAEQIKALVNACNPWHKGAATRWQNWMFGLTDVSISNKTHSGKPAGTILSIDEVNGFTIACLDNQVIHAAVVYCEEGYYAGYRLSRFGLKKEDLLE